VGCAKSKENERLNTNNLTILTPTTSSTSRANTITHGSQTVQLKKRPSLVPLTENEIQSRIEGPSESQVVRIGDVQYKYAWISQRGFYPHGMIFVAVVSSPHSCDKNQIKRIKTPFRSFLRSTKLRMEPSLQSMMVMVIKAISVLDM
jgi:hypothetical protein